jgi:PPOX class probable F420-dependent enzyme
VIPEEFHPLLESRALALVSTLGPGGAPQITPIWFLFDGGRVRFSLVEGRQKLRNLRRDPRVSVVVIDPSRPTHYIELRGVAVAVVLAQQVGVPEPRQRLGGHGQRPHCGVEGPALGPGAK